MNTLEYKVIELGTGYELPDYEVIEGKGLAQTTDTTFIQFVRGSKLAKEAVTPRKGILHETLLAMMIEDLEYKNSLVPSKESEETIKYLKAALECQLARAAKRKTAGTQGTYKK